MPNYYVNSHAQANGDHEVHTETCIWLPNSQNRISLGNYTNCSEAVSKAKTYYSQSNGCKTCSNACHTG